MLQRAAEHGGRDEDRCIDQGASTINVGGGLGTFQHEISWTRFYDEKFPLIALALAGRELSKGEPLEIGHYGAPITFHLLEATAHQARVSSDWNVYSTAGEVLHQNHIEFVFVADSPWPVKIYDGRILTAEVTDRRSGGEPVFLPAFDWASLRSRLSPWASPLPIGRDCPSNWIPLADAIDYAASQDDEVAQASTSGIVSHVRLSPWRSVEPVLLGSEQRQAEISIATDSGGVSFMVVES
ncbi:MAG: hypothetical protein AABY18_09140, partial [Candidatus Thermoplasmatota archaeon]